MRTELYGDAKIEPYGVVRIGNNVLEFVSGMAFLNDKDGDIGIDKAVSMIANYLSDIELIDNGDGEPCVAVLISDQGGLRFHNPGAFHMFCRSLVYANND